MKRNRSTSKSKASDKPEIAKQPGSEESAVFSEQASKAEPDATPAEADNRERQEQNRGRSGDQVAPAATVQRDSPRAVGEEGGDPESERRRIAERAYSLYVQGGREEGKALEHWLEAERELSHTAKSSDHQWDH